jgi:hypothetical protein
MGYAFFGHGGVRTDRSEGFEPIEPRGSMQSKRGVRCNRSEGFEPIEARGSMQSKRGLRTDRSEGFDAVEAEASNRSKRRLRVHFNLPCAVIARNEAIQVILLLDCFPAFAMTVHGTLSCNDGHSMKNDILKCTRQTPFIVKEASASGKTARNAI